MVAVYKAVDLLGGMRGVQPGAGAYQAGLLKRAAGKAVTTHPEIIQAVIRLVRSRRKSLVGDSRKFGDLRKVAEKAGI
jgi:uncharacterized protein (DUF362 family)